MRRECGMSSHEEPSCDIGMIEAATIGPIIKQDENLIRTAERNSLN